MKPVDFSIVIYILEMIKKYQKDYRVIEQFNEAIQLLKKEQDTYKKLH